MTAHNTALAFALMKVLSMQIGEARKTADTQIRDAWKVKDRNAAVLPDGTEIGSVTLAKGRSVSRLADEDAYLAWVLETCPEEIETITITRVRPGFTEQIMSAARQLGKAVDAATGEQVPGITVEQGEPYPTVRLADDAAEVVARAWQDGTLTELVAGLLRPAIEGGDTA